MSGWIKCSERMPQLPKGGGKAWVIAYTPARKAQSAFNGARFLTGMALTGATGMARASSTA